MTLSSLLLSFQRHSSHKTGVFQPLASRTTQPQTEPPFSCLFYLFPTTTTTTPLQWCVSIEWRSFLMNRFGFDLWYFRDFFLPAHSSSSAASNVGDDPSTDGRAVHVRRMDGRVLRDVDLFRGGCRCYVSFPRGVLFLHSGSISCTVIVAWIPNDPSSGKWGP